MPPMTWTLFTPQQQRGAQLHNRLGETPQPGEAVKDRAAQDHEQAGGLTQPGEAPASRLQDKDDDNTPTARNPRVEWDDVVQPERQEEASELTELEQDERGEDVEAAPGDRND